MAWLEDVIAWASPKTAYEREAWRQGLESLRGYDAGDGNRLNSGWRVANESAEMTDRVSRDTIRARTRDLERSSDIMNSVTSAFRRNVIGKGYTLHPMTGDQELDKKVMKLWKKWCKKQNCDVTGTQNFNQMLRMAVQRKKVDGGILFVKRYTPDGLLPFKIQTMEPDELDVTRMTPKNKNNRVVGGIEYNSYNKPIGYFFRQYEIDGFTMAEPIYVEAKDVIFYFTKRRPSQIREMSDMAHTTTRIRDTNEFMTAVSVKERILSCLAVFIKKVTPAVSQNGREAIRGEGAKKKSYEGKMITPGMIRELNAGDEIQVVNPSGQATDAERYTKTQERLIGAGNGISYEAASRDMSQSTYSSARQGMIEDEMTYYEEVEWIMDIMSEVYETFFISAVLKGLINIKDFWESKEQYLEHEWIRPTKQWIDPLKEANATKIALMSGQKTFPQVAAENGNDWRKQLDETAEALKYAEEKGIDLGGMIYGIKTSQKSNGKVG